MKVLVISHMYPSTFSEVAGIFVHKQVKELVRQGCEIKVISPIPWTPFPIQHLSLKYKRYSEIPACAVWDGIEVYYPRFLSFPRMLFFASSGRWMYRGIRALVNEIHREFPFELIHAHTALPDGYAGAMLAQTLGCPLVITIHGRDLQHTIHRSVGCREAIAYAIRSAARVIVVSRKLERLAEQFFPSEAEKLMVVSNGVDLAEIDLALKKSCQEDGDGPRIVSVSNLMRPKGIDLNLHAIHRLCANHPTIKYIVVGDGPEFRALRALAGRLSIEDRVEFVGRVPHIRALQYIAVADVFSLPSWSEGFGIVYLEAMACGKPVIACRGEGPEDFVEHEKTGLLVKPRDVDSLVEALDFLLSNPEEAWAMGERARKVVLENYTWEKNAEKMVKLYKELLKA
jgi:glycosyltransferase involved in cell wall biosynthesis